MLTDISQNSSAGPLMAKASSDGCYREQLTEARTQLTSAQSDAAAAKADASAAQSDRGKRYRDWVVESLRRFRDSVSLRLC